MKIIVIGMDNTGKSTLVQKLGSELGIKISGSIGRASRSSQKDWVVEEMVENVSKVYDRFAPFEEIVYGSVMRGRSPNFTPHDVYVNFIRYRKPLVIYCRPSDEAVLNFGDRPQMDGVIENAKELLRAYDQLYDETLTIDGWDTMKYDYESDPDATKIITLIKERTHG